MSVLLHTITGCCRFIVVPTAPEGEGTGRREFGWM
jgi:hypothetical protein